MAGARGGLFESGAVERRRYLYALFKVQFLGCERYDASCVQVGI